MLKTRLLRQLLSFVLLLLALPAWASPAFVNSQQKTGGTTGSNGLILATTAGNSILVFVGFDNNQANAPHVTGVTDSQGNTYAQLGVIQPNNVTCNGTGGSTACVFMEVWYTLSAASTGSNTITVASTPTGAGTAPAISALQYSGVGAINLTNVATGSGTSATSGTLTITTSQGEDFIVGSFADRAPVSSARLFALADELASRDPEAFAQLFIQVVRKMPAVDKPGYEHVAACIVLGTLQVSGVTGCFADLRPKLATGDPLAFRAALERFLERFETCLEQIAGLSAQEWGPEKIADLGARPQERQFVM